MKNSQFRTQNSEFAIPNSQFSPYPKYKDSGVEWLGQVPEHWEVNRFKHIFKEREERSQKGEETLLSVSAYTGVSPRSDVIDAGDYLSRAESLEGYKICRKDDLVMNIMLAWNRGLAFTGHDGIVSPAYCVFYLIDHSIPQFLNYLVRSDEYTLYFKAFSAGVIDSRLRLYPDTFGCLKCCLPPHPEQIAIAAFLDRETAKIDALVSEQQRLIELLKEERQAVISHAVTKGLNPNAPMKPSGIEWLGDVPEAWKIPRLGYYATVENGTTPSRDNTEYWFNGDIPWLSSGEVNQYRITECQEHITASALKECSLRLLPKGTIVVGMIGQGKTRGMSASLEIEATINQNLAALVPAAELNSDYLLYIFQSAYEYLREFGRGGNQAALNCEILSATKIPLPTRAEQAQIARHLGSVLPQLNTLLSESERAIELLQERRTALISAAVTGQIDVSAKALRLPRPSD